MSTIPKESIKDAVFSAWDQYKETGYGLKQTQFRDIICHHYFGHPYSSCMAQKKDLEVLDVKSSALNRSLLSPEPATDRLARTVRTALLTYAAPDRIYAEREDTPSPPKTWYAKIHPASKYHGQFAGVERIRFVPDIAGYCVKADGNQYRLSDMEFYQQSAGDDQYFEPINLLEDETALLQRLLVNTKAYIETQEKGDYVDLVNLYRYSKNDVFGLMRDVLEALPKSDPTCPDCGKVSRHCNCEW